MLGFTLGSDFLLLLGGCVRVRPHRILLVEEDRCVFRHLFEVKTVDFIPSGGDFLEHCPLFHRVSFDEHRPHRGQIAFVRFDEDFDLFSDGVEGFFDILLVFEGRFDPSEREFLLLLIERLEFLLKLDSSGGFLLQIGDFRLFFAQNCLFFLRRGLVLVAGLAKTTPIVAGSRFVRLFHLFLRLVSLRFRRLKGVFVLLRSFRSFFLRFFLGFRGLLLGDLLFRRVHGRGCRVRGRRGIGFVSGEGPGEFVQFVDWGVSVWVHGLLW